MSDRSKFDIEKTPWAKALAIEHYHGALYHDIIHDMRYRKVCIEPRDSVVAGDGAGAGVCVCVILPSRSLAIESFETRALAVKFCKEMHLKLITEEI